MLVRIALSADEGFGSPTAILNNTSLSLSNSSVKLRGFPGIVYQLYLLQAYELTLVRYCENVLSDVCKRCG